MTRQNNNQWTRLQCRLSSPRQACAAVVVHNRYVVILGGHTGRQHLSSVDILDMAPPHNNNNNGEPTIVAGPSMNSSRYFFWSCCDGQLYLGGGWKKSQRNGIELSRISLVPAGSIGQRIIQIATAMQVVSFPIPHGQWNHT